MSISCFHFSFLYPVKPKTKKIYNINDYIYKKKIHISSDPVSFNRVQCFYPHCIGYSIRNFILFLYLFIEKLNSTILFYCKVNIQMFTRITEYLKKSGEYRAPLNHSPARQWRVCSRIWRVKIAYLLASVASDIF